jgi:hypothetical protein
MKLLLPFLAVAAAGLATAPAFAANDYPTSARVLYVQECIAAHPGHSNFEMVSKCSCALDAMAADTPYDDYVSMWTIVNARTIGGERGGQLRDNSSLDAPAKRYRELQAQAAKGCFLTP